MSSDPLLTTLLATLEREEAVARVVVVEGKETGTWALVRASDAPGWEALGAGEDALAEARAALARRRHTTITLEDRTYWVEVIGTPPTLLIAGAGHLAEPLAVLGAMCDFHVAVLDDRPQYANPARFPSAHEVLAEPFTDALRRYPLDADTYIVLVTRGHAHDVACLVEVLDRPHAYIGMVGSRRRVQAVWELLEREKGIQRERLGQVFAPIGLDIGAENPAEIAVAIMAEIILVRRGGTGIPLSDALRERGARVHTARIQRRQEKR
jgi:xanthine dehydrogenase accessory factor